MTASIASSMASRPTLPGDEGVTPCLQLHLVDSNDEPITNGAGGERRPSTASLSRFRSCPQLSSADGHLPDSPESDDLGLGPELLVTHVHFTHGSPRHRQPRQLHQEEQGEGCSQTPTPPSSPTGSRRSHVSLKEALCGGGGGGGGGGAGAYDGAVTTTPPRAVGHAKLGHSRLGRTVSQDSPSNQVPLRSQDDFLLHHNHLRAAAGDQFSDRGSRTVSEIFDEPPDIGIEDRMTSTGDDGASTPLGEREPRFHGDPDSMDKCARWLQSLKMTAGDRLKSRSHIQLPPI